MLIFFQRGHWQSRQSTPAASGTESFKYWQPRTEWKRKRTTLQTIFRTSITRFWMGTHQKSPHHLYSTACFRRWKMPVPGGTKKQTVPQKSFATTSNHPIVWKKCKRLCKEQFATPTETEWHILPSFWGAPTSSKQCAKTTCTWCATPPSPSLLARSASCLTSWCRTREQRFLSSMSAWRPNVPGCTKESFFVFVCCVLVWNPESSRQTSRPHFFWLSWPDSQASRRRDVASILPKQSFAPSWSQVIRLKNCSWRVLYCHFQVTTSCCQCYLKCLFVTLFVWNECFTLTLLFIPT